MSEFNKSEFGYANFDDITRLAVHDVPVNLGEVRYGDLLFLRKLLMESELSEERPIMLETYNRLIDHLDRQERQEINGDFI